MIAQDPQNEEAREGVRRIYAIVRPRLQSAVTAGRFDEPARLLQAFRDAGITDESVTSLEAQIAAVRARTQEAEARVAATALATEARLGELATRARAAIAW